MAATIKTFVRENIFIVNDKAEFNFGKIMEDNEKIIYNLCENIILLKYDIKKHETSVIYTAIDGTGGMQTISTEINFYKKLIDERWRINTTTYKTSIIYGDDANICINVKEDNSIDLVYIIED